MSRRRTTLGTLTARDPFLREASEFSGRPWAVGSDSSNPEGNLSPPSIRRIRNTTAFHILPGPLTPRAQTSAGLRSPGRCQRAGAVPQAAHPRGRPEPAPSEGPGDDCRRWDWPAPPAPQGLRQRQGSGCPPPSPRVGGLERECGARGRRGSRALIGQSCGGRGGWREGGGPRPVRSSPASSLAAPVFHHLQPAPAVGRLGAARSA